MDTPEYMALVHQWEKILEVHGISAQSSDSSVTGRVILMSAPDLDHALELTAPEKRAIDISMSDDNDGDEIFSYPPLFWDIAEEHSLHPKELSKSFLEELSAESDEEIRQMAAAQGKPVASKEQVKSEAEEFWQFLEENFGPKAA